MTMVTVELPHLTRPTGATGSIGHPIHGHVINGHAAGVHAPGVQPVIRRASA
jgi:hypothetical protein